eukprot:584050-Pyramimonas_sp.AAC.1
MINIIVLMVFCLAFLARQMRRSLRQLNRKRGGWKRPADSISLGAIARPAPLFRGFPGQKQTSPKFLIIATDTDGGDYWDTSKDEFHQDSRKQVESLVN